MTSKKALRLIKWGLHPVLLGSAGHDLKRPLRKGWQTAVYTPEDVARWPARNNMGIRCGWQRGGRAFIVFDFDEASQNIFPTWCWPVNQWLHQGHIRFLRQGGSLITDDGCGWYSCNDQTRGGLAKLLAWQQALVAEGI